jgi:hypothetical protein
MSSLLDRPRISLMRDVELLSGAIAPRSSRQGVPRNDAYIGAALTLS